MHTPPAVDEIEVSLFGPGYGECVLIHIGHHQWIVVDSCVVDRKSQPAALQYLEQLGFDPIDAVVLVVATHWHDDHVRGLSKVVEKCSNAEFACSHAISSREFCSLVLGSKKQSNFSGALEFCNIFEEIEGRGQQVRLASANKHLWKSSAIVEGSPPCSVYSLSPSDYECQKAIGSISELVPDVAKLRKSIPAPDVNDTSVALLIDIDGQTILLGADLEETCDPRSGWSVVVDGAADLYKKASVFKVAHHGSENGHFAAVWEKMLNTEPYAILSPFNRGKKKLPSPTDITRLKGLSDKVYLTSDDTMSRKVKKRSKVVSRVLKDRTGFHRYVEGACGHVRLRKKISAPATSWSVSVSGNACKL